MAGRDKMEEEFKQELQQLKDVMQKQDPYETIEILKRYLAEHLEMDLEVTFSANPLLVQIREVSPSEKKSNWYRDAVGKCL